MADLLLDTELDPLQRDYAETIRDSGASLLTVINDILTSLVKGDAGRIRQILLNLAGNAIKFTIKGEVSLEIKVVETSAFGTRVRCEVRDTGIGIPADRLQSLFAPFMQVDASTTRRFGGTGLGLSIVRRLVELMGGETGVDSIEGEGSVFWFTACFAPAVDSSQPRYS